jgi:hypothetical protein
MSGCFIEPEPTCDLCGHGFNGRDPHPQESGSAFYGMIFCPECHNATKDLVFYVDFYPRENVFPLIRSYAIVGRMFRDGKEIYSETYHEERGRITPDKQGFDRALYVAMDWLVQNLDPNKGEN